MIDRGPFHMTPLQGITVSISRACSRVRTARCCSPTWARASSRSNSRAKATTRAPGVRRSSRARARTSSASTATRKASRSTSRARRARRSSIGSSRRATCSSRTSGRARWRSSGSTTPSLAPTHPRLVYCSISGFGQTGPRAAKPGYDAVMQAEGGLMSITGAADGPPFRLGVAIADIVSGMFAAQGIAAGAVRARAHRARTARGRRHARLGRRAADLSGGHLLRDRRGAGAARQSPSDDRAVRDVRGVGRRVRARGRQRRPMASVLRGRRPRPTTSGSRPTGSASRATTSCGRFSRAFARPSRAHHWIDRLTAAGVPCGSVRDLHEVFTDPQLAAREMIATLDHADDRRAPACSAFRSSCRTRRARSARRRRRSASTRKRLARRPGLDARRDRGASRSEGVSLMEISDVKKRRSKPSSGPNARPPSGGRAPTKRRAVTTCFSIRLPCRCSARSPTCSRSQGYRVHRLHPRRQRAADVGPFRATTTSSCARHRASDRPVIGHASRSRGRAWSNPSAPLGGAGDRRSHGRGRPGVRAEGTGPLVER